MHSDNCSKLPIDLKRSYCVQSDLYPRKKLGNLEVRTSGLAGFSARSSSTGSIKNRLSTIFMLTTTSTMRASTIVLQSSNKACRWKAVPTADSGRECLTASTIEVISMLCTSWSRKGMYLGMITIP
mmetsp:Transcript_36211/g.71198  ORF Transcript_36211/g.71198 Transcript_36211/m.71198 type:complete len:126 (-) Transcript_36211:448-825(-)